MAVKLPRSIYISRPESSIPEREEQLYTDVRVMFDEVSEALTKSAGRPIKAQCTVAIIGGVVKPEGVSDYDRPYVHFRISLDAEVLFESSFPYTDRNSKALRHLAIQLMALGINSLSKVNIPML